MMPAAGTLAALALDGPVCGRLVTLPHGYVKTLGWERLDPGDGWLYFDVRYEIEHVRDDYYLATVYHIGRREPAERGGLR